MNQTSTAVKISNNLSLLPINSSGTLCRAIAGTLLSCMAAQMHLQVTVIKNRQESLNPGKVFSE